MHAFNPIRIGEGFLELPLAKKVNNLKTVQAMTTQLGDFS